MVSSATLSTPTRGSGPGSVEYERAAGQLVDGRYELLRPLGRGGMGEVWVARDGVLKTEVALKFLSRELDDELAEHLRQRFRFEAQVSALLAQATEDIARVHDVGNDGGSPYLVMELVAGRSLERVIDEQGAMAPALFLPIFARLCGALEVAHAHGIVHRDIKPANVLIGTSHRGEMRVVLTDFGIAKGGLGHLPLDRPKDTREGFMVGSPDYMAPEQFRGSSSDRRIDLWTMGVLAYEAMTGRRPFSGRTMPEMIAAITTGDYPAPTTLVHALPAGVDRWFERALAKDPAQRFGSPREMAGSLRACFEPVAAAAPVPSPPARGRGSVSTRWLALAALVLVISAAAVAVLRSADGDGAAAAPELEAPVAAGTPTAAELGTPPSAPVAPSAPAAVAPVEQGPAPSTQADAPAASATPTARAGAPAAPRTPRPPARPVDPNPNEPSAVF